MKKKLLFTLATLPLFVGCSKDDETLIDEETKVLISHPWRIVASALTDNLAMPAETVDEFAKSPAYIRDNTYQFNADNSLTFDEGASKENASDEQKASGKWQFLDGQATLLITLRKSVALGTIGISSSTAYNIFKLSADTLRLTTGTQAQTAVITLSK